MATHMLALTLFPAPPLLLELLLARPCALSRKLSRALKLLDTAIFVLVSLAESTLELPRSRPHLLARALADGGPDEGEGDGDGDTTDVKASVRFSSVKISFAGS